MLTRATKYLAVNGLALAAIAATMPTAQAQKVVGNVLIPETSIERPQDVGLRSHTNHVILLNPAGGLGPGGGMTPAQIRSFYGVSGSGGGTIAIVDAYDYPTAASDLSAFSNQFSLPAPNFQVVYQGGTRPMKNAGWALEEALDIEWAHAMAPSAKIILVEAQSNSNTNLYEAVDLAVQIVGVKEISMSWGSGESSGETANDYHFNLSGPLFFASSGDTGGQSIYPSVSPYVTAAGGTSVATNSDGSFKGETGWSGSGGGNSPYESKPSYQVGVANTGSGRSVPDISSDADPNTGVSVYDTTRYQGHIGWWVVGGTSVSSPSLAGMVNASGGTYASTQALLTSIYANLAKNSTGTYFRDITSGTAGSFSCLPGWDFVTGVGAPIGPTSF